MARQTTWQIPPEDPDSTIDVPPPPMASIQYLGLALRRGWRTWAGLAVVGLLLGLALPVLRPPASVATVTLLMAHPPGSDPASAMSTDVSILRTRSVADRVIDRLGLDVTAEQLQASLDVDPATSAVLVLRIPAPDDEAALARVSVLAEEYLGFRSDQVRAESDALVAGNEARIAVLRQRAVTLTRRYRALADAGPVGRDRASAVLTERSRVYTQVNDLEQANENSALAASTLISATHVLDAPSIEPSSVLRGRVLPVLSGVVVGGALGAGLVLLRALTSTRLRTRAEIALAVGAPVLCSAGAIRGPRRWLRRWPRGGAGRDLEVLAHGLASQCAGVGRRPTRIAVGTLDNPKDVELLVGGVGARLSQAGRRVLLVDLGRRGGLGRAVSAALAKEGRQGQPTVAPVVLRPDGVPGLARGPLGRVPDHDLKGDPAARSAWEAADVVLTLTEVDPSVGVDELATWARRMVLVVTSGRSSVERLRNTGDLVRSAGIDLVGVLLVGDDRTDVTLGSLTLDGAVADQPSVASR
jgi:capsular polysaccharide biosynthesis protein